MSTSYRHTVLIDSRDVDGRGFCKASALLGHLQEAATRASEAGCFDRETLIDRYNGFWMLTRMWYRLDRPLRWGEELTIHTWHRGSHRAAMYRDYDLYVNDQMVGEGVSAWVLADMNTRRLIRLNQVHEFDGTDGGELCKNIHLNRLRCPPEMHQVERRPMRYSDTDINGHVNNTRYADFACDALELENLPEDQFLSRMQICYLAECRPGQKLMLETGAQGEVHFVRGLNESGKSSFEADLFFGKVFP